MSPETATYQAESYIAFECKHGNDVDRAATFKRWADSKDFSRSERAEIRAALRTLGVKVRVA